MKPPRHTPDQPRGDWRWTLGGCITLSLGTCLLLASCAIDKAKPAPRETPAVTSLPPELPATIAKPLPIAATSRKPISLEEPGPENIWARLNQRFAMPGCDYHSEVLRWAHIYTQSPQGFQNSLTQAMPFLLIVLDQLERRDLPGEFAMLPYIESTYTPLVSRGDRPGGMWQIIPDTARNYGIRINTDYDGRLDMYASTTAALDMIKQYQQEFGDWRLANMAFNAGEFRVKQLVKGRGIDLSSNDLRKISFDAETHEHLTKLLALSCVISNPERFHVTLPQPQEADYLHVVDLDAPVDLRLAARLAHLSDAELRRLNPGYLLPRMPDAGPYRLLLPKTRVASFEQTLAQLPKSQWRDWHPVRLQQTEPLALLADFHGISETALATINALTMGDSALTGSELLVPGRDSENSAHETPIMPPPRLIAASTGGGKLHVVTSGDTLWHIATRYGIQVRDLLRWNNLSVASTLQLGQKLHVVNPDNA